MRSTESTIRARSSSASWSSCSCDSVRRSAGPVIESRSMGSGVPNGRWAGRHRGGPGFSTVPGPRHRRTTQPVGPAPSRVTRLTAMPGLDADLDRVVDVVAFQATACAQSSSPLYGRILDAVVADLRAGGVSAELLTGRGDDPLGSALALRFLGAVHRIVLDGRAPDAGRVLPVDGRRQRGRSGAGVPPHGRAPPRRGVPAHRRRRADERGGSFRRARRRLRRGRRGAPACRCGCSRSVPARASTCGGTTSPTTRVASVAGDPTARCASSGCGRATRRTSRRRFEVVERAGATGTPSTPPPPRAGSP